MSAAIATFESSVPLPSLEEICSSTGLNREYTPQLVSSRPHADPLIEELLQTLATTMRRPHGPSLVISNKTRPEGVIPIGGHYVMTVFYNGDCAAPGVIFWMRFNNKLHAFNHRYDNNIAQHAVADITRPHVLN